jgi:chorismate mutase
MTNVLASLRKEINEIDYQIVSLIAQRMEIIKKVGTYKAANNIPPLDEKRWQEIIATLTAKAHHHNLSSQFIENLYNLIHQEALRIENIHYE